MIHYNDFMNMSLSDDDIFTFDIETSSYWETPTGVQGYTEDYKPEDYNAFPCGAVCYIWQFSINETVYYGRELSEFPEFLEVVFSNYEGKEDPIIWVHNLAYEFVFCAEYLKIYYDTIFARTKRKPMKFKAGKYGGNDLEFRCSYMLTRLSLDAWGKDLGFKKLHTLDYTILRTPKTKLEPLEVAYCERDCLVVYKGIQKYVEKYGNQHKIPMTQTGEVRQEVRENMKDKAYTKSITNMLPKTEEEYILLRSIFQGGSTGGNYLYTGVTLPLIGSDDKQSFYPSAMVSFKYPMQRFCYCSPSDVKLSNFDEWAFIIGCEFTNIDSKTCLHYYSRHKAVAIEKGEYDNGKLIKAKKLYCCLTEQDLLIMNKVYKWDKFKIIECYKAKKQYLPKKYIEIILERYAYKTTLKGDEDKKELYAQSKQFINSCYGMMVTDILQPDVKFNGGEWIETQTNIQNALNKLQRNRSKNFLNYSWGCWVTAYCRAMLWVGATEEEYYKNEPLGMIATPNDIIYYDTDSRKHKLTDEVSSILQREDEINLIRLHKMCDYYNLPYDAVEPKDPKGKKRTIGAWDFEGVYDEFRHLGAKRYAVKKDGKIEVTVSGVPKKAGSDMIKNLSEFYDGFEFDANHRDKETGLYDGKMLSIYCDGNNLQTVLNNGQYDEYKTTNINSVVLRNNGYKLGITDEYKLLVMTGKERGFIK